MPNISHDDLEEAKSLLFDARNLIDALRLAAKDLKDDQGNHGLVIRSVAAFAMEKIDDVTGGAVFDPPPTPRDIAKAKVALGMDTA